VQQSTDVLNTTVLVHRADRSASSWWRTAAICDLPGAFGAGDLDALNGSLEGIRKIGFDAILIRTASADISREQAELARLVNYAHSVNLKVLVRIVGAPDDQVTLPSETPPQVSLDEDRDRLIARTRLVVRAGVDGVDIGLIDDDPTLQHAALRAEGFTQTIHMGLAELAEAESSTILTAEATQENPEYFGRHLTEDWFHHLRDDALYGSPWDADAIQARTRRAYQNRDPLGMTTAWRPSLVTWAENPRLRGSVPGAWEENAPQPRSAAMVAYSASLPGAVYLPYLSCGGSVHLAGFGKPRLRLGLGETPGEMFLRGLTASILHLRQDYELGSASLAFIEGLSWAPPGIAVHLSGPLLVVLNTSAREVVVPPQHVPLVYSGGFLDSSSSGTNVEPERCAWFVAGRPNPVDPAHY